MKILVYSPTARHIGPAIVSHIAAVESWRTDNMTGELDWVHDYGTPAATPVQTWIGDGVFAEYHEATKASYKVILSKFLRGREMFLAGNWDVFVTIEDDMIIPPDTFKRLAAMIEGGAGVGYGLYTWRHNLFPSANNHWSAYLRLDQTEGRSIALDPVAAQAAWGSVIDVVGVGMACTVIRRDVLERIPFRLGGPAANDWYFALDCQAAGVVQRCDLGLVCGHFSAKPTPRILWPDPTAADMRRHELLEALI